MELIATMILPLHDYLGPNTKKQWLQQQQQQQIQIEIPEFLTSQLNKA